MGVGVGWHTSVAVAHRKISGYLPDFRFDVGAVARVALWRWAARPDPRAARPSWVRLRGKC